jgi:hypothetical protein
MYPFRTPIALTQTKNGKQSELVNEKKNQTWMKSGRNPKLSVSMSKEPDLEDFTTLSLLVVSVFSYSRRIGVDLTITVQFKNFDGRFEDFPVLD